MKPGQELDALVAEKVFGLTVSKNHKGGWSIGAPEYYDDRGSLELFNPLPAYSEDIAAAWTIVEKLSFFGSGFKLHGEFCGHLGQDGFICKFGNFNDNGWHDGFFADTAPHAICLAALQAMGEL